MDARCAIERKLFAWKRRSERQAARQAATPVRRRVGTRVRIAVNERCWATTGVHLMRDL